MLLIPRRHSSVLPNALTIVARAGRQGLSLTPGAGSNPQRSNTPSHHDSDLSWRTSQTGNSLRRDRTDRASSRPGPAVVGYLVKDVSPSGVRIPRLNVNASLGSTTIICPGLPGVHLSHASSPRYGSRARDGPETVGYLLNKETTSHG